MLNYELLRRYDVETLKRIINNNKEYIEKEKSVNNLDHVRLAEKEIKKIEKVIKEKSVKK